MLLRLHGAIAGFNAKGWDPLEETGNDKGGELL